MSFDDRFELGELLRDDGIRTYSVREKTGGQELLAHFLGNSSEAPALLASLDRLLERERQRIVDRGEREGSPYVVTGSLAGHAGFREWLAANAREPRPLGAAGAWKVIPAQPSVDEQFLSLFPTAETPQVQPEAAPHEPPAPPPAGQPEAGEFTRMFQAPLAHLPPPQTPEPRRDAVKQGPQNSDQPGEFTRLFQALPPQTLPEPSRPVSKKADAPGEFTRFFEAQVHESHARMDLPPVQAAPAASRQGEFTRVFGPMGSVDKPGTTPPQALPSRAPEPPRPTEPAAQATRAFASPLSAPPSAALPAAFSPNQAPSSAQSTIPAGQVGNDFTMRFSVAPALSLGQPAETPAASAPSTGNASSSGPGAAARWPLYLGIAAIVVLLAAVILFFATRSK